jgi:LPS-assembly lipoprotein
MNRRLFLALIPAALAAGCGFQLRRYDGLPFASLYLDGGGAVTQRLRSMLTSAQNIQLPATAAEAEAVLKISHEERTKSILTLTGGGRVSEYRLTLKVSYALLGKDGIELAAPETFELVRSMTYDDSLHLAKGAEEQLLYRDMDENAALRIVRRMQMLKSAAAQ